MRCVAVKIVSVLTRRIFKATLLLGGAGLLISIPQVSAQEALTRSVKLKNSEVNAVTTYEISFQVATAGALGSIKVEFCDNSPLIGTPCTAPAGFDISNANLDSESGETGFNIDTLTTANVLVLSRTAAVALGGQVAYELSNIQNGSMAGAVYTRITTYAASDTSGPILDRGGLAYSYNPGFTVSTEVPPYITLCVANTIQGVDCATASGSYVNLGDFTPVYASTGQTQMVVATNASFGYTITVSGQTMTSGNNIIPSLSTPTASMPGTSQFGINLRSNASPASGNEPGGNGWGQPTAGYNQPNFFKYASGDVVASHNSVENLRKYTVTYLVNVNKNQAPGIYASTFTYIALGSF